MILVIGMKNCSECIIAKKELDDKNITYEYLLFNELNKQDQERYTFMAREKNHNSLPLIIKDNKLITIQEV